MKTNFILFTVTLSLVLPALARAEEEKASAADIEQAYQIVCVPGSAAEKALPAEKLADVIKFRDRFHQFLLDPKAVLATAEKTLFDSKSSGMDRFGAAITVGMTCGVADAIKEDINSRGCKDTAGVSRDAKAALAYCADLEARMKKDADGK